MQRPRWALRTVHRAVARAQRRPRALFALSPARQDRRQQVAQWYFSRLCCGVGSDGVAAALERLPRAQWREAASRFNGYKLGQQPQRICGSLQNAAAMIHEHMHSMHRNLRCHRAI